jgi:hypothetical protein
VVDGIGINDEREFENVLVIVVVDGLLVVGDVDIDLSSPVQRITLTWPAEVVIDAVANIFHVHSPVDPCH